MHSTNPTQALLPWPEEGAVVIQQPDDALVRKANYDRARLCVAACHPFTDVVGDIAALIAGAQVAVSVLPGTSDLGARLRTILSAVEAASV